jgi:hypothetical protein
VWVWVFFFWLAPFSRELTRRKLLLAGSIDKICKHVLQKTQKVYKTYKIRLDFRKPSCVRPPATCPHAGSYAGFTRAGGPEGEAGRVAAN